MKLLGIVSYANWPIDIVSNGARPANRRTRFCELRQLPKRHCELGRWSNVKSAMMPDRPVGISIAINSGGNHPIIFARPWNGPIREADRRIGMFVLP